jgi:hypothetical protein
MRCKATDLKEPLDELAANGSSKIESNNIIIYRNPETNMLELCSASISAHLIVKTDITLEDESDKFYFTDAISVSEKTLTSIVSGMGSLDVEITFHESSEGFIKLETSKEKYDLSYSIPIKSDINKIFEISTDDYTILLDETPVDDLQNVSPLIANLGSIVADTKYRTVLYREGTKFRAAILTSTTLNLFECTVKDSPEYKSSPLTGIDTNTSSVSKLFGHIISYLKAGTLLSVLYRENSLVIKTDRIFLRTSFEPKDETLERSITMYTNTVDIMAREDVIPINIKINGQELETMINKASLMMSKSIVNRLDSHVPLYVTSNKAVEVNFKSAFGSYNCKAEENIAVDGLKDSYAENSFMYNINVPMMKSMLNTINKAFSGRVVISIKHTVDKKTYVKVNSEDNDSIKYITRLRR